MRLVLEYSEPLVVRSSGPSMSQHPNGRRFIGGWLIALRDLVVRMVEVVPSDGWFGCRRLFLAPLTGLRLE